MNPQKGILFFNELSKIEDIKDESKQYSFIQLFFTVVEEVSSQELIPFNTLFSRLAYVGSKYGISGKALYGLHALRKKIGSNENFEPGDWDMGFWVMSQLLCHVYKLKVPLGLDLYEGYQIDVQRKKYSDYINNARVTLLGIDHDNKVISIVDQADPGTELKLVYDEVDINEDFTINIEALRSHNILPVEAHLHHIRLDSRGHWHPEIIVIEPDHLMDVTSVAGCFHPFGIFTEEYLINRFLPKPRSKPILIGMIANYFLDQLIHNSNYSFNELFPKTFSLSPLSFALLSDEDVRDIMNQSKSHFEHLKIAVNDTFPNEGIALKNILLEPSFYSPSYGLQGRLDILHQRSDEQKIDIIELKSGKPFRPNIYGLSASHYIQTLLYDVIVKSIRKKNISPTCFILYSKLSDRAMRHAPYVQSKIEESMIVRNALIIFEKIFAHGNIHQVLDGIKKIDFPHVHGFAADKIVEFDSVYRKLNTVEKEYLLAYCGFIAREQKLSKLGSDISEVNGLSGLWRNKLNQKMDNFNIINHLIFESIDMSSATLELIKSDKTNFLSNFRKGDICILYADEDGQEDVLESHVLKGTILELTKEKVLLRLRSVSMSEDSFKANKYWHIEHDLIDSSFYQLYRGLFRFLRSDIKNKEIILGLEKPKESYSPDPKLYNPEMSEEQNRILNRMVVSEDYFLLWGPPGTGKTSIMLRYYVDYLLNQTSDQIMILAYTNRAVDEICKSISVIPNLEFMRIGSRYSCDPQFSDKLLVNIMQSISTRKEIGALFANTRIIVGTISSVNGKSELWKLKSFDRIIVDEASQILEPQIVGILSQFKHFTLIGDHRQLPAVSLQDKKDSRTSSLELNGIGITQLDNSLFERLFARCNEKKWNHAYAMLSAQGRMHGDVLRFPSEEFYDGQLTVLKNVDKIKDRMNFNWNWSDFKKSVSYPIILKQRSVFIPSKLDLNAQNIKTNKHEAIVVRDLVRDYTKSILTIKDYSIGIITPFRAQIATIRAVLQEDNLETQNITIDTVERYQGGAKDIIIISLCVNHRRQLDMMMKSIHDGVDRKLNVALTRAKEQVILIGNPKLLNRVSLYKRFIDSYGIISSQ